MDKAFTTNDSSVWMSPSSFEAWTARNENETFEGIPDMVPVNELNERPIGRDPERMENDRLSPWHDGVVMK